MLSINTLSCRALAGDPEDVRVRGQESSGAEGKALVAIDLEARSFDGGQCVPAQMAATGELGPEGCVSETLPGRLYRPLGDNVLIEAELAARSEHTGEFGEGSRLVGHGAEHEGCYNTLIEAREQGVANLV
jgi:hypothetical protein